METVAPACNWTKQVFCDVIADISAAASPGVKGHQRHRHMETLYRYQTILICLISPITSAGFQTFDARLMIIRCMVLGFILKSGKPPPAKILLDNFNCLSAYSTVGVFVRAVVRAILT